MRTRDCYHARLGLERLESREVLATYLWIADPMGQRLWSNGQNWVETTTGARMAPAAGDSVIFDPTLVVNKNGVFTGSQATSIDDIGGLAVKDVLIKKFYAGTVQLNNPLHVTGLVHMEGGAFGGTQKLLIDPGARLDWVAGKLGADVTVGAAMGARSTMTISGPGGRRLDDDCDLLLMGDTTWAGGNIVMGDGAKIINGPTGIFNAVCGGGVNSIFFATANPPFLAIPLVKPRFVNEGTFNRTVGNTTIQFNIPLENQGTVNLAVGTLKMGEEFKQTGGTTTVTGTATLDVDQRFNLSLLAGDVYGTATLRGNVINSGATVAPGTNLVGGTLTVEGNYTQQAGGTLKLRIRDAASGIDVRAAGKLAGKATYGGGLEIERDAVYEPTAGTTIKPIKAVKTGGAFASTTWQNNDWNAGGVNNIQFEAVKKASGMELKARAPGGGAVVQAPVGVLLASNAASIAPGQAVTFTVVVTTSGPAPTEAFLYLNDLVLGTVALAPSGPDTYTGTLVTSSIEAGEYQITAAFEGSEEQEPGFSSPVSLSVVASSPLATSVALALSQPTAYPWELVELTATVAAPGLATGTVVFYSDGQIIGQATLDGNGVATLGVVNLAQGTRNLSAVYLGDSNFDTSLSATAPLEMLPL